jgi:twitching motility protein PilI
VEVIRSAEQTIALLHDIERRSKQKAAGLSQQDSLDSAWSAIGFRLNSHHFLLPLNESREILPLPNLVTPVPKAQSWVHGIVNLRGELLPVFDLEGFLFGKQIKTTKRSRIIVVNHPDFYTGILVDEVFGLKHFQLEAEQVDPLRSPNILPFLTGGIFQQNQQWDVFSFHKLISDPRFENVAA